MKKYCNSSGRRDFIRQSSTLAAFYFAPSILVRAIPAKKIMPVPVPKEKINLMVNGKKMAIEVDPRTSLLDFLREELALTGTKKGCDMGQCGACMVHVNGKRLNSCLSLAVDHDNQSITTIEGLSSGDNLHPLQEAFVNHDAMQCGYCTPGQIMSAVTCIREGHANSRAAIREYMSENICRCGSYQNIVDAIVEVKKSGKKV